MSALRRLVWASWWLQYATGRLALGARRLLARLLGTTDAAPVFEEPQPIAHPAALSVDWDASLRPDGQMFLIHEESWRCAGYCQPGRCQCPGSPERAL